MTHLIATILSWMYHRSTPKKYSDLLDKMEKGFTGSHVSQTQNIYGLTKKEKLLKYGDRGNHSI